MKIGVRGGHHRTCTGAVGIISELAEDRKVKDAVIKYLKAEGHTVVDCTPPDNMIFNVSQDLCYGVNKANNNNVDLFVSIHFNNYYKHYEGSLGTEVCVYRNNTIAKRIVDNLGALGFKNRGQKVRTKLYELKATNMPSVIVETCFVEATEDVKLYKNLGYDRIGKVIAEAICNKKINNPENNNPKYIVTNYLPEGRGGDGTSGIGVDLEYVLPWFKGVRCYLRHDGHGYYIETQYLSDEKIKEVKESIGSWFYCVRE